jgi:HlyD family secretion protein
MAEPKKKRRSRLWLFVVLILVLGLAGGAAYLVATGKLQRPGAASAPIPTGAVTTVTAVNSVTDSGPISAQQSGSVSWQTTGAVAEVLVKPGDHVKAGDVLMRLQTQSAPSSIIQAESELLAAQTALHDLQNPSQLSLATAQQAVTTAEDNLQKAQKDLRNAQNPAGQGLYDAVSNGKLALDTATTNATLATVSADAQALAQATSNTNIAFSHYQNFQAKWDAGDHSDLMYNLVQTTHSAYQSALDTQTQLELRIQSDQANKNDAVSKAQKTYDDAVNNLNAALKGPDAMKLAVAQSKVDVATATLADAKDKLAKLKAGGAPDDVKAAQARVQAAQAIVAALELKAPFDGEVLAVNDQPGDTASPTQAALTLANRSRYHIDVLVDESEVTSIGLGNPAQVTFSPLPGLALSGTVAAIQPQGQTVQGLVKYTVRVELDQFDPRVLLGMTANVNIVTSTQANALAVPLDAVQLDKQGEFVNRVDELGAVERVPVLSGAVQDTLVIVKGNLKPGDNVQIVKPVPTNNGSPFGGG